MSGSLEMKYENHKLENYIMDMLTLETCKLFLPAAFIKTEKEVIASYQTEGYGRLSDLKEIETEDIFNIVLSLLEGVDDAEHHYIFANEYEINTESVFVQKGMHKAKVLFIPEKRDRPLEEKIAALLEELKENAHEEGKEYLEDAINFIGQNTFGSKAMTHHLEKLRKEVYLCGIK